VTHHGVSGFCGFFVSHVKGMGIHFFLCGVSLPCLKPLCRTIEVLHCTSNHCQEALQ
jgi:hypothetical protein